MLTHEIDHRLGPCRESCSTKVTATIVSPRRTEQWDAVADAASMDFDDALAEQVGSLFA